MIRPVSSTDQNRADLVRLVGSCALLAVVIGVAAPLISALVHRGFSAEALSAAGIAGGICFLAAAVALVATHLGNRFQAPVQGLLVSMIFRMGLPLVALIALPNLGGPFAASGVSSTILGVYLVALAVETALALRMIPPTPTAPAAKA